jgi:hypothetical protein
MRIEVRLPKVEPEVYDMPEQCPYEQCGGKHYKPHRLKSEKKAIRDLRHTGVESYRWRCLKCGRKFRVYPRGVSNAQQSKRLKAITGSEGRPILSGRDWPYFDQRKWPITPEGVRSSPEALQEDLESLQQLVRERPQDGIDQLEKLYHRYKAAPTPKKGQRHTVWYRTRMLVTRLLERWPSLTLDQRRGDLDGTNNTCERVIGWWIKERYRTMRGYKRPRSVRNVATLTARMGVRSGRYDMSELYM